MIGKWRVRKTAGWWNVFSPDGKFHGTAREFKQAVAMVNCTTDGWINREMQRAALCRLRELTR